jgi:chromosome partitioning protein
LAADLVLVDTAGFGNRAAAVAMTSADAVLILTLSGEADIKEAEKTVRLVGGLARAARRDLPARVLLNRVKRTQLARHAAREIERAILPLLAATLSDLWRDDVLGPDPRSRCRRGGTDATGRGTSDNRLDT